MNNVNQSGAELSRLGDAGACRCPSGSIAYWSSLRVRVDARVLVCGVCVSLCV